MNKLTMLAVLGAFLLPACAVESNDESEPNETAHEVAGTTVHTSAMKSPTGGGNCPDGYVDAGDGTCVLTSDPAGGGGVGIGIGGSITGGGGSGGNGGSSSGHVGGSGDGLNPRLTACNDRCSFADDMCESRASTSAAITACRTKASLCLQACARHFPQ